MKKSYRNSTAKLVLLVGVAALSLSACAGPYVPTKWAEEEAKVIEVRAHTQTVRLSISNDTGTVTDQGLESLYQAVQKIGQPGSAEAVISPERNDYQLAVAEVRAMLTNQGLDVRNIEIDTANAGNLGTAMEVSLIGYTATVSACPNWTYPNALTTVTSDVSNFGCATMMNLASSVSDPRDLAQGRPLGRASGVSAVAAITRYNKGETKALAKNNSMIVGGAGGAGN